MKKRINKIIVLVTCFLFTIVSCEIDNYDKPASSFSGGIKDVTTGTLVETDLQNGSAIRAYELGFETLAAQTWVIKNTGEFRNDMVFPGHYNLEFINGNFYPFTVDNFEIKPGVNTHDFEVTPYIRIKDVTIAHNTGNNRVVATFKLEAGKPEVKLKSIRLYAFTDIHVGEQVKFNTTGADFKQDFGTAQTIDGSTVYTLSIDLNENEIFFGLSRNYYFRVGALASVPNVGTVRYNYAPLVKIAL